MNPALDAAMFDAFTSGSGRSHRGGGGSSKDGCLVIILIMAIVAGVGFIQKSCSEKSRPANDYTENSITSSGEDYDFTDYPDLDTTEYESTDASSSSSYSSSHSSYSSSHSYYGGYDDDDEYDEDGYDEDGYDEDGNYADW